MLQYSLGPQSTRISATATLVQFPIKLAACVTTHKMQGANISHPTKVVMDLKSVFSPSQGYVMLSRVERLDQIYILEEFDNKYLKLSKTGLDELRRLEDISFNRNPTPWHTNSPTTVHIASLNCAGLRAHFQDILMDNKLLRADVLHLDETSVEASQSAEERFSIPDFHASFASVGNGKGVVTYSKELLCQSNIIRPKLQIVKTTVAANLDSINVYRSSDASILDALQVNSFFFKLINILLPSLLSGLEIHD